jgi:hypothetical protein
MIAVMLFSNPRQVRQYVSETIGKEVSSSWTWRLVSHYPGVLQRAAAHPQEDTRMQVTKDILKIHVRNLERYIQNVPTELILRHDEMGSQEWLDRMTQDIIISHQPSPRRIEYSVPRKEKRISDITTISMAGDVLMPLLVIHRKTGDDAAWEDGWRDGQDFLIRSNNTSYVTHSIFK